MALLGAFIITIGTSTWAAEDEKRIINGPRRTSFGGLELVLGQGASAEAAFQPPSARRWRCLGTEAHGNSASIEIAWRRF